MPLLDSLQATMHKILPEKKHGIPLQSSGGIGNGHAPFEDDVRALLTLPVHFPFFVVSGWVRTPHGMVCRTADQLRFGREDMKSNMLLRNTPMFDFYHLEHPPLHVCRQADT